MVSKPITSCSVTRWGSTPHGMKCSQRTKTVGAVRPLERGIEASEHRLKALRGIEAGALPGKSLVVYEPASGLVSDVFPCEDGHAQERSLFAAVLGTVRAGDLWIADRNFCTRELLCTMDARGAAFVIRAHRGLPYESVSPLRPLGRGETGHIAEQRVRVVDAQGGVPMCRRLRVTRAT